jgi:hypothetical protein
MSIPGFNTAITLYGKALKVSNINGKCFKKCPAASAAWSVSSQKGEKSGLSRRFQLWLRVYKVMTSVARHMYTSRIGIGWPSFLDSSMRPQSFSIIKWSIGCRRATACFEKKGFRAARRTRCSLWSAVAKADPSSPHCLTKKRDLSRGWCRE